MRTNAEIETLLTEIEGREQKAMPGPWAWDCAPYNYDPTQDAPSPWLISESCQGRDVIYGDYIECSEPNADFISHSRQDIPALVKLVRELMQQLDSLRRVGGTMANVMYNVKQRSPLVITEREREIIAALQQEWDLLSRSVPQEDKQ